MRTATWKLRTFVISAAWPGLAGGFYAFILGAVQYSNFTGQLSLIVMIMVLVGGVSSLLGAVIGAVIMSWLSYAFTSFATYQTALYALVLLLLLLFLPGGLIMGLESRYVEALRRPLKAAGGSAAQRLPVVVAGTRVARPRRRRRRLEAGSSAPVGVAAAIERWKEGAKPDSVARRV